jgi:hypothetical protein
MCSQLQGEVQRKFSLSEEVSRAEKGVAEVGVRLGRKVNRWRRLLANLDPLISFISGSSEAGPLLQGDFKAIGWAGSAHFWLHSSLNQLIENRAAFEEEFRKINCVYEILKN